MRVLPRGVLVHLDGGMGQADHRGGRGVDVGGDLRRLHPEVHLDRRVAAQEEGHRLERRGVVGRVGDAAGLRGPGVELHVLVALHVVGDGDVLPEPALLGVLLVDDAGGRRRPDERHGADAAENVHDDVVLRLLGVARRESRRGRGRAEIAQLPHRLGHLRRHERLGVRVDPPVEGELVREVDRLVGRDEVISVALDGVELQYAAHVRRGEARVLLAPH